MAPAEAQRSLRKRVLVVDDEHEFRRVLVEYLEGKAFDVMEAVDGLDALRRIPEFRPHVVLLDIALPRLSGVEVLRKIKALPQPTCVIVVSGIDDLEMAKQTLAMGAADYVPKPVDFQYLDTVLETHLFLGEI